MLLPDVSGAEVALDVSGETAVDDESPEALELLLLPKSSNELVSFLVEFPEDSVLVEELNALLGGVVLSTDELAKAEGSLPWRRSRWNSFSSPWTSGFPISIGSSKPVCRLVCASKEASCASRRLADLAGLVSGNRKSGMTEMSPRFGSRSSMRLGESTCCTRSTAECCRSSGPCWISHVYVPASARSGLHTTRRLTVQRLELTLWILSEPRDETG